LVREPRQHVVGAVVADADGAELVSRGDVVGDVHGLADLGQGVGAGGGELDQLRGEVVLAGLQIDRAWQAEVADSVDGASVGVARSGDGLDGGGELAFGGLVVDVKGVAPLIVAGAGFHLPGGRQRAGVGYLVRAHVVQHHHQHVVAVGSGR